MGKFTHLLRVLSRKSVSKSSQPATSPMQTPRKARQKTKRSAPMMTEPVRLLHLKQHEFTTGIVDFVENEDRSIKCGGCKEFALILDPRLLCNLHTASSVHLVAI